MSDDQNIKSEINQLIQEYADIRCKFEICKKKHPRYLEGNDNYVGIIGEYWATIFLEQKYESAIKDFLDRKAAENIPKSDEKECGIPYSKSTEWLDFIVNHKEDEKKEFISVKAISSENKKGTSGKIKYPTFEDKKLECKYILSVIIVKLDKNLQPEQLLYIKDLDSNLKNCKGTHYNYSDHWKKGSDSLVFKYYKNGGFDEISSFKIWRWNGDEFIQKELL